MAKKYSFDFKKVMKDKKYSKELKIELGKAMTLAAQEKLDTDLMKKIAPKSITELEKKNEELGWVGELMRAILLGNKAFQSTSDFFDKNGNLTKQFKDTAIVEITRLGKDKKTLMTQLDISPQHANLNAEEFFKILKANFFGGEVPLEAVRKIANIPNTDKKVMLFDAKLGIDKKYMDEIALSIETYLAKDLGDSVWENFKKGKLKDSIKEELKNTKLGDDK